MRDLSAASDAELVAAHNGGDKRAFGLLYDRHGTWSYRRVLSCVRQEQDAAEIDQEVWTTLFRSLPTYTPDAQFRTYLNRIISSRVSDHFRTISRRPTLVAVQMGGDNEDEPEFDPPSGDPGPGVIAASNQAMAVFNAELAAMPEAERAAFTLKEFTDKSWQEIAETLGIPLETARTRHRRAVQRLQKALKPWMTQE